MSPEKVANRLKSWVWGKINFDPPAINISKSIDIVQGIANVEVLLSDTTVVELEFIVVELLELDEL